MSNIWSQLINLAGNITGLLPAANGGTGISTAASTGVAKVASGTWSVATIVNADIDAAAAIDGSKIVAATGALPGGLSTSAQTLGAGVKTFSSGIIIGGNTTSDANLGTISSVTNSAYYEGTFSLTFTGGVVSTAKTLSYVRVGKAVTITMPSITATGASAASITSGANMPSALHAATTTYGAFSGNDNGTSFVGVFRVTTGGSLDMFRNPNESTNWSGTGTASTGAISFTYTL